MRIVNFVIASLIFFQGFAQNQTEAEKIVIEGIEFHDKGDYDTAISIYDSALELDKDNLFALAEKAMSLNAAHKFDESIAVAKYTIKAHPNKDLRNLYVSYANSLDQSKKPKEALKVYDQGLKKYPDYYQLHFNKGITYSTMQEYDEALKCFHKSISIKPHHASSLNAIGILEMQQNRIPSILAFSRFLIVEPQTSRSKSNKEYLQNLLMQGVTKTGENSINITIDSETLANSSKKKKRDNDFGSTELILSLAASQDFAADQENQTEVQKFIRKFEVLCASLQENKKDNSGFYWDFIVPYFVEMNNKNFVEQFAYIVFVESSSEDVSQWHKMNQRKLDEFYDWSQKYDWRNK